MNSRSKGTKEIVFLTVCVMGLLAILSSTMSKTPVLPYFAGYLNTPGFWEGLVYSASTIPGILISLPAGSLSDVLGRRKVLLISSVIFASAPFLYLLVNLWWQLALVRFYHGFATAMFVPVAEALVTEAYPTRRGERISLFSSATVIGRSIAPLLGGSILVVTNPGLLPQQYSNFGGLYLAVGVVGVTVFITALPFLSKTQNADAKEATKVNLRKVIRGWKDIAKTHGVLAVSLVEAGQYYTYASVESFLVKYMTYVAFIDGFSQGVIMFSLVIVVVLSKPLIGRLSDKTDRRTPIVLGCIVSSIPVVAVPFFTQFSALLILAMAYGLGFSMVTSATPALVSELVPIEACGGAIGFISTLMDVGQTLGPIICGVILSTFLGYLGIFSSLVIILLSTAAAFALFGIGRADSESKVCQTSNETKVLS
ncbi:MAG: MFS transporter [Candidatus Bathyarchaeia archaeon]